jgi:hypothetical protein
MIRRVVTCLAAASFVLMPIAAQAGAPVRPGSALVATAVPAGIRAGIEPGTDVSNLHGSTSALIVILLAAGASSFAIYEILRHHHSVSPR